uniref:Cathepsin propeptide inhibitor domain-containing protein n=1 Tax=Oryza meridionalis TaxID=40149 RepID=A0A0E0D7X4_9ORYZ
MSTAALLAWFARDVSAARDAARLAAAAASRAARSSASLCTLGGRRRGTPRSTLSRRRRIARRARAVSCIPSYNLDDYSDYEPATPAPPSPLPSYGPEPADDETDKDFETDLVNDATDKDFESDEAIWAFYERWCKAYDKERDDAEMAHRFKIFNETAELVHKSNKDAPEEEKLCFGPYRDGFDEQQRAEFLLKFGHFHGIHEFVEQWKIDFSKLRKIDSPNQSL